ncbi:MAG: hypothetical protein NC033_01640 [Clostridiales bacterium]|nr:hypothetical protein [Clostridiales bacterium]
MRKFKKVLICAAACVTAATFTGLTACTDREPGPGLTADVTVAESMSAEELSEQVAKFDGVSASSFTVDGQLQVVKLLGGALPDGIYIAQVNAKGNLDDGDADVLLNMNKALFEDEDAPATYGAAAVAEGETTGDEGEQEEQTVELNVFLRGWNLFATSAPGEDTYDYINLNEIFSSALTADTSETVGAGFGQYIASALGGDSIAQSLVLANATDSIVVDESAHTITLDINKTVYGLYGYVKQIVNNLTTGTTLSGLLKCSAVKYFANAYLGDMTGEELLETVMGVIEGGAGGGVGGVTPFADTAEVNPFAAIAPLPEESAYDYIVRMLDSKEVAALMGSDKTIGSAKIVDMLGEDGAAALKALKQNINSLDGTVLSESTITIPSTEQSPYAVDTEISDMTVVYTFNEEDVLQSVSLTGTVVADMDGECEMALSLDIVLPDKKVPAGEFTDISGYVVNLYDDYDEIIGTTTVGAILNPAE